MKMTETTSIVGVFVAMIAVSISIFSLKQNQKSIERANRPYVVIYMEILQILTTKNKFIIIKIFGKTGAIINSLTFYPEYYSKPLQQEVFENIKDLGKSDEYKKITAKIKYSIEKNNMKASLY